MSARFSVEQLCSWCGSTVEAGDGYRLAEFPGERRAAFCRLEHLVPWALRGGHWEPGPHEVALANEAGGSCAQCSDPLGDVRLVLVRHRGEQRIADPFCSVDHAAAWARAGGRYG